MLVLVVKRGPLSVVDRLDILLLNHAVKIKRRNQRFVKLLLLS